MNDIAIQIESLSKRYRIGAKERLHDSLASAITSWFKAPIRNYTQLRRLSKFQNGDEEDTIWALNDISFDVHCGEVVGVIGRNGAGKTTLLKILTRITEPTSGRVVINGRVSSLLEVGTGFHPDLTGRENVYLNGAILGMSKKEIDRKFDEIVAFSEVEKFIDTPVKRYSSGMKVRLAFAVAAHLEPEIMMVDEVLAVGDNAFQTKCLDKMGDVAKGGRTILFVSHDMNAIQRLCTRCVLLKDSKIAMIGDPNEVITYYLRDVSPSAGKYSNSNQSNDSIVLRSASILDMEENPASQLKLRQPFQIEMIWEKRERTKGAFYYIKIYDSFNRLIAIDNTENFQMNDESTGTYKVKVAINPNRLAAGLYYVTLGCHKLRKGDLHIIPHAFQFQIVNVVAQPGDKTYRTRSNTALLLLDTVWSMEQKGSPTRSE
jgi:lipopolysaccharide transport system ATP-binding protein